MKKISVLFFVLLLSSGLVFGQRVVPVGPGQAESAGDARRVQASGIIAIQQSGSWFYGSFELRHAPASGIFSPESLRILTGPLFSTMSLSHGFPLSEYAESKQLVLANSPVALIQVNETTIQLYATAGDFSCMRGWVDSKAGYMTWLFSTQWTDGRQATSIRIQRLQR